MLFSVDSPGNPKYTPAAMIERIDTSRIDAARAVIEYVLPRVDDSGLFRPEESLWAESGVYRAQLGGTLAVAGGLLGDDRCIEAARRILYRMLDVRLGKLWGMDWWWDHPIAVQPPADWERQNATVDEGYEAPTNLFDLGLYYRVTGDDAVVGPARESMAAMFDRWDYMAGEFNHMTAEHAALAAWAWEDALPEFASKKDPIIAWVVDRFVEEAPHDFPFMSAVRMTLLLAATGTEHLESTIGPGIDALLAEPSRRYEHNRNDFRHNASTSNHVNCRANIAVAIMMKHYDLAAGEQVYTSTPLYEYLSEWIDGMCSPGGSYFECRDIESGRKYGQGSPAHYIPLWWILGARLP